MLDQVDRRVRDWVLSVLGDVQVSLESPVASSRGAGAEVGTGSGVSLYLIECVAAPPPRGVGRPPLQITLRYMVTTWAAKPEEAHRLLGDLLFAALDGKDYDVDLSHTDAATWAALGVSPQPSFTLEAHLKLERAEPPTRYVRVPLVVQAGPMVPLQGSVVGPGDMPIAGARVEALGLNMWERTDSHGRFQFAGVPGGPKPLRLRVKAKGREMAVLVPQPASGDPVTIRFDSFE